MATHDDIKREFETYLAENEKFTQKGIKASATRARKALMEVAKLAKVRRTEIVAEKEALENK